MPVGAPRTGITRLSADWTRPRPYAPLTRRNGTNMGNTQRYGRRDDSSPLRGDQRHRQTTAVPTGRQRRDGAAPVPRVTPSLRTRTSPGAPRPAVNDNEPGPSPCPAQERHPQLGFQPRHRAGLGKRRIIDRPQRACPRRGRAAVAARPTDRLVAPEPWP